MKPLQINQRNRWFAVSLHLAGMAAVALALCGFHWGVYQAWGTERDQHAARLEQLEMLLAQAATVQNEHGELKSELARLHRTVEQTRQRLPAEPLDGAFVSDVRQLAKTIGLEVIDHRLGPQQRVATHSQSEISFRFRGSYASMCRLLDEVEQFARITKISKFEVEAEDKLDAYPIQVTFVLYYGAHSNDTNQRRDIL